MARPKSASRDELLLGGIALFNGGRFFEAHELWEDAWKRSEGAEKLFYQGLIHAAAAIIQVRRGNRDGAASQFGKCIARLNPLAPSFMDLAIDRLLAELRVFVDANRERKGDNPDCTPPVIRKARGPDWN
jgi:predicted metal-dependent hydrolase